MSADDMRRDDAIPRYRPILILILMKRQIGFGFEGSCASRVVYFAYSNSCLTGIPRQAFAVLVLL